MAPPTHTLTAHQVARLLGCDTAALTTHAGEKEAFTSLEVDALVIQPPTWLLGARADFLLRSVVISVEASLDEALAATTALEEVVQTTVLSNSDVADLLGLDEDSVAAFEPRRGWNAGEVADLLRNPPSWTASPRDARLAARKQSAKAAASLQRRAANQQAKERQGNRNREKWAEIASLPLDDIPLTFTKVPTRDAVARFWKRLPGWATNAKPQAT